MLRRRDPRRPLLLASCAVTFVVLVGVYLARDRRSALAAARGTDPLVAPSRSLPAASLARITELDGRYVVPLDGDARAELTLDPALQHLAEDTLAERAAPLGAIVVLSVEDGRVLALAGRSGDEGGRKAVELTTLPWAPAASVFKVVTAAALVGKGVGPESRVCYHGGIHAVDASNLASHPRLDDQCNSLAFGVAHSQNAILARLAHDHLDATSLDATARALGFGAPLPIGLELPASPVEIPTAPLDFAQTAAGFWHTSLSPLHGAYLAATIARDGETPPLHLVEKIVDGGQAIASAPPPPRAALAPEVARAVGRMMVGTTEVGTAKRSFQDARGRRYLPGVAVAGKTGSLSGFEGSGYTPRPAQTGAATERPMSYSWFVGFAPADHPRVAFAILLGNDHPWQPRAHQLARRILDGYFAGPATSPPSSAQPQLVAHR